MTGSAPAAPEREPAGGPTAQAGAATAATATAATAAATGTPPGVSRRLVGPAGAKPVPSSPIIDQLNEILSWSRTQPTRIGYFAALYWHVERAISAALEAGEFQHPDLLQKVNEVFFARYTDALDRYRKGERTSLSWLAGFDATRDDELIVVQHLLLGANAHINFDLSVAVAQAVPVDRLIEFRPDYDRMNDLLAGLFNDVSSDLSRVWPLLKWISQHFGGLEDAILGFSMRLAREGAWADAAKMAAMHGTEREAAIHERDTRVAGVAELMIKPGRLASGVVWLIRRGERGNIGAIISDLLD